MNAVITSLPFYTIFISCYGCDLTILNKGRGGNNIADLLKRSDFAVTSKKPDLVVLIVGTNDMVNSAKMIPERKFTSMLDSLIRTLKRANTDLV